MIDSNSIKKIILKFGADLCGFAPIERFKEAPQGFHPCDIYRSCKSVIVFAIKMPTTSLFASSCIPYTHIQNLVIQEVDQLTLKLTRRIEKMGIGCVPIPSDDPYEHWEPERSYGRAILSLKHAAYLAGLGTLGKNTLLLNDQYGNMVQLGAILVNVNLNGDPTANYNLCDDNCQICLENCPKKALNGITVDQKLCRELSTFKTEKGYILRKCNLCRKLCPSAFGINKNKLERLS